jgi:hypothetical protein
MRKANFDWIVVANNIFFGGDSPFQRKDRRNQATRDSIEKGFYIPFFCIHNKSIVYKEI